MTLAGCVLASSLPASAMPITFQVNMSIQAGLGSFNPASDTVEVHGSFDSWGAGAVLAASPSDSNVFQGIVDVSGSAGNAIQYKFVINQGGTLAWEDNGVGPNGAQNRTFTLTGTAQTLPVVYFNNQSSPPGHGKVTVQVNLEIQKSMGNFNPAADAVEVHGSFDSWGSGLTLSASATNASVYQAALDVVGSPGAAFEYKFVINKAGTRTWEGNVGPGGTDGNRIFTLTSADLVLPVVYFDNVSVDPGAGVGVTFRVNMGVQAALGLFDPASGTMTVSGAFNNWSTTETPLTNNMAEPNIYTGATAIKASAGASIPFKFVANGGTWEAGDNRTFALGTNPQTLPILFFSNQSSLGVLTVVRSAAAELSASWTAGPAVRLQSSASLSGGWQDVPNSTGVDSITVPLGSGSQVFRLVGP